MATMASFLRDNFHFIHVVSALALLLLALVFLAVRRDGWVRGRLSVVWPLAAFALFHSVAHGTEGFIAYRAMLGETGNRVFLEGAAAVFDVLSFGFLLHFGLRGLLPASSRWGHLLAPSLMALWVAGLAGAAILDPLRAEQWIESTQGLWEVVLAPVSGLLAALVFWRVRQERLRFTTRAVAVTLFTFGVLEGIEPFFHGVEIVHALLMAAVAVALGLAVGHLFSLGIGGKLAGGLVAGYAITLIVGSTGYLGFGVVEREVARSEALEEEAREFLNLQWRREYQELRAGTGGSGGVKEIMERVERYQAEHRSEVLRARARVKEARNNIRRAILLGLGLASAGAALFGFAFTRAITAPLKILRQGTAKIGRGEFSPIEVSTGDEMEELAGEFNAMAESLRVRTNEILALNSITLAVNESLELDQVLSTILEKVLDAMEVDAGVVYLWDEESQLLSVRAQRGFSPAYVSGVDRIRMGEGLVGKVAQSGEPAIVEDVLEDPRIIRPQYVAAEGIRSVLMVPLRSKAVTVGMFYVATRQPRHFAPRDVALMVSMGRQVATAIENARLFEESRARAKALDERSRQLLLLHLAARFLSTEHDRDRLLQRMVESAAELIGSRYGALAAIGDDGKVTKFFTAGIDADTRERIGSPPEGRGLLGYVFREGKTLRLDNLAAHPEAAGMPSHHPMMKNLLAAPIRHQERILGALYLTEKEAGFTADDEELITTLCTDAAVAMENARLVEELKSALEEVKAAQERIVRTATLSAVGELAAGASHHLNNLLAVIVGRAQILLRDVKDPALERPLRIMERAALDGADVVRRVQQFSRARVGGECVPVDLNQIASEVIELTRPRWHDEAQSQGRGIEVTLDEEPVPSVCGHAAELREVVTNFILNAVDALPEGGRIVLRTWKDGQWVSLSVADTGTGMSAEVKARAFEPFFTTKGVKSTGLGLSVAHGIIQRHGGEIAIESDEGKGTTVTVRLPAVQREVTVREAPKNETGHRARILVIDDAPDVREALADLLSVEGHTVTCAADGYQGIAKLEEGAFDLVLTDLGMPGINGWQVAEAVRARFPGMPVALVTGWATTLKPGEEERVDGVLTKPFQIDAVRELLGRLVSATPLGGGAPSDNGFRGQ